VHLSDNDGSYDMHDALGSQNIDFVEVFNILEKKKYDEICVIEVKSLPNVYKSIEYLKNIGIL
jgi:sugar phosphate isomerase/epimerase